MSSSNDTGQPVNRPIQDGSAAAAADVSTLSAPPGRSIAQSHKLAGVGYDIRGPVMDESIRLEEEGHKIIKLNIGNPAPWGLEAPEEIVQDVIRNLPASQGYCDSKGLFAARKAVMQQCQQQGIPNVTVDDVFIGNGVSELVQMAVQGLINDGDEVLIPAPDFPLWSAVVSLAGGTPVHYRCDEASDWQPDIADMRAKTTSRTRAVVVINPNNPTGAVYEADVLDAIVGLARERDMVIFADEIYDKITYDGAEYIPMATRSDDLLTVSFSGLSKAYRAAGFRTGWMILSGAKRRAADYIAGLNVLSNLRLCSNVPTQHAVQTALGGYQSIFDLTEPGGLLHRQRTLAHSLLNQIEGVSCTLPKGALYLFPKIDTKRYNIVSDEQFALDLLREVKVLVTHGSGFHWPEPDHFRLVFLPREEILRDAIERLERFLATYRQ